MQLSLKVDLVCDGDLATWRSDLIKRLIILGFEILDNGHVRPDGKIVVKLKQPLEH
jgi:hypothetical protein